MNCLDDEIERMQEEIKNYSQRLEDHSKDTDLLKKLYGNGFIDIDGDPVQKDI